MLLFWKREDSISEHAGIHILSPEQEPHVKRKPLPLEDSRLNPRQACNISITHLKTLVWRAGH